MDDKPIKSIKETRVQTAELVLTTVLIAAGINLVVFGICSLLPKTNGAIFIIVGSILVSISLGLILWRHFLQSCRKKIVTAALLYNKESKSIVNIPNYDFAEDIYSYLNAAISEDANIKGMWLQDELGLTNIFNEISPTNTYIAVSRSGAVLNQLIEYLVLKELSVLTTDYFNSSPFDKKKIKKLQQTDIADLTASNVFLSLFSKPTYERVAFGNKPTDIDFGYGKDGAIYDKFELTLPVNCEVLRKHHNIITIIHPLFTLTITPSFTGFGETIPHNFIKRYLRIEDAKYISSFKIWVGIDLKFSWKALFINKAEYYEWIDKFIDTISNYASIEGFFDKISWNIIEAMLQCKA